MGFLFGGSGGTTSTNSSSSTSHTDYTPQYDAYVNNILSKAQDLGNTPFPAYDVSKMFAPFNATQQQAFNQVGANQTGYLPYINSATGALNNVSGYNPLAAGMPWLNAAANTPNAYQAGSGYLTAAAQGWNPQTQAAYTNPFLSGALGYSTQLAQQNLMENTLPQINDQFVKSGGGLGRERNQEFLARATRDFNNAQIGQYNTAAANNYWQGANQFNTDQSRLATVGAGLGSLANTAQGTLGSLGNTAAGITSGAINTGAGLAGAYSNLGGVLSNLGLTNTNALLQIGNQQQQQAQNPLTAQYQQFQQGVQWPFQLVNFMNAAQRGLQIPTTTTTQSQSTTNNSSNSSPSLLGGILGTLGSVMSIPGVSDWAGGQLSSLFGGSTPMTGFSQVQSGQYGPLAGNGVTTGFAKGGAISRRGEPAPRRYAVGGSVPVVKGMLSNFGPSQRAIMGRQGRPPQMGPAMGPAMAAGLPPIPPPVAAGALRGAGAR